MEVGQKPVLLYLFDGHTDKGSDFDYSKIVEAKTFGDKKVVKLSREFICEKICVKADELFREVPGREVLKKYLGSLSDPKSRKARIVLLSHTGEVVESFEKPVTARALLEAMKEAQEANARALPGKG